MADGTASGRRWVAMRTKEPHKEKLACRWLENAGFEVLLPVVTVSGYRRRRGNRERITLSRLALPGYVFVGVGVFTTAGDVIATARDRVTVLGRPVGMNGRPLLLQEGWDDSMLLDPEGLAEEVYVPQPGQTVTLNGAAGVYEGYTGLVDSVSAREVRMIVDALHRSLALTVPRHAVRQVA